MPGCWDNHTGGDWLAFALSHRIPTACEFKFHGGGCLLTYGLMLGEFSRRNARQIDQILRGAKPVDLPFEQVTRFELIIDMKTARTIGATIPQSLLVRADEVLQ